MDIGLYRSRVGVVTVFVASLIDFLGWCAFAVLLNFQHPFSFSGIAQMLWSHSTLLSFIVGIITGNSLLLSKKSRQRLSVFVVTALSPLFFLSIGTRVNFAEHFNFLLILLVILVASISKLLGAYTGGRLSGLNGKEALAVGFALNARGAMEIILSKQALEAGLIEPGLFVALVVMAVITSTLSVPAIKCLILNTHNKGEKYASTFKTAAEQVPAG